MGPAAVRDRFCTCPGRRPKTLARRSMDAAPYSDRLQGVVLVLLRAKLGQTVKQIGSKPAKAGQTQPKPVKLG